jgi:hypothetical protein
MPGSFPISPIQAQAAKHHSLSPETVGSIIIQNNFFQPLVSQSPSPKRSRGGTPLDPVLVGDVDSNRRDWAEHSLPRHTERQPAHQLIVELPSNAPDIRPLGHDGKIDSRKQTGEKSLYFADRQKGERLTAATLREEPRSDVIDLSED